MIDISEIFFSLNGEGLLIGAPSVFVRLSKCNLRCAWCDTKYAWEPGRIVSAKDITEKVNRVNAGCQWVVITGGEPLLQDITPLVDHIQCNTNFKICVETNGTLYNQVLYQCDFISADIKPPSSGNPTTDIEPLDRIMKVIKKNRGQLKAVIADEHDYAFVHSFVTNNSVEVPVVLQPCYNTMEYSTLYTLYKKTPLNTQSVRILPQIHKIGGFK
ncbi:MAG: 7-carboxy-7-deazaguanine synthase QueE [Candidatus Methanofastidiosia archaeon]|jgi:7-carboxy-7-deazaguanine synthase